MARTIISQFRQAVLIAGLALAAPMAQAAALVAVSGSWVSTNDDDGTYGLNGLGTDQIFWGSPATSRGQSGYEFQSATQSGGFDIEAGTQFDLGTFIHHNRTIWTRGRHTDGMASSIRGAQLKVDYALDFGGGDLRRYSSVFDFLHNETRNRSNPCANGEANGVGVNSNGCADKVTLTRNDDQSDSFVIDGLRYQLDISGLLGDTPFWTAEDAENPLELVGLFTTEAVPPPPVPPPPTPVPLPAPAGALVLALLGLGLVGRRRG